MIQPLTNGVDILLNPQSYHDPTPSELSESLPRQPDLDDVKQGLIKPSHLSM